MTAPIPVIICDDSVLARKQAAKALSGWNVQITFAEHGLQALEAIRQDLGDILFLDLNMPIMDGYQVLERIRQEDLNTLVIVISGDIQPDARAKVLQLGALEFIKKPIDAKTLSAVLHQYGLLTELSPQEAASKHPLKMAVDLKDYYQEVANIAMGQAGDRLARLLNTFLHLPVPSVALLEPKQLESKLRNAYGQENVAIVTEGFSGLEVAGEALLIFNETNIDHIAAVLNYDTASKTLSEKEILIELANILSSAFLHSFANQLDLNFSQCAPVILCAADETDHTPVHIGTHAHTLAISIPYTLTSPPISCELLVLFTEDSLAALNDRTSLFE